MDLDYSNPYYGKPVAIHFGSGRQLPELIDLCERIRVPIIQGSTKLTVSIPSDRRVVIIKAPNLSLPMIRFVSAFPAFAAAINIGMSVRIVESHQSKKADTSGTARAVAKTLGVAESTIKSVRDPDIQLSLGVPEEHLDGHAYHDFIFTGQGVEIKISTKIRGRATYAEGALTLAQALADQQEPLKNGIYELKDILYLLPTK
jgi:dihydrodipicolinate reductase